MKQLTQKLKNGKLQVLDVPVPMPGRGMILVRNHYSLISAGTEGGTVTAARKNLISKATERPQQVRQVFEVLKQQGPVQAYRAVVKKLDAHSPMGYSSVGTVIASEPSESGYSPGDLVGCGGGGYACHAEVVVVPKNLCVKLPLSFLQNGDLHRYMRMAAYNTLGAIAIQGVRQADLRLGEACAVIGLGLLGQLTCLLLKAAGLRVVGVDVNPAMVEMAGKHCADLALERSESEIEARISEFTNGIGCDGVIITAATDSSDPINFAGALARKRGTVVVVGAVPTGFDREPHYYRKELQVRMSCSYGPGRYDPDYEEKGHDYPAGYVRWTEKRNMEAFQQLIASGKIDVSYLTTHIFKLEDAPKAYDLILEKKEPYLGILIEYDHAKEIEVGKIQTARPSSNLQPPASISIGFIGAGSYAQSHLLPNIPKDADIALVGVMTSSSTSSRSAADRYGFQFCTGDAADVLGSDAINTVFIATRHNSHAKYVLQALKAGKHVFVEKPLCLALKELDEIIKVYSDLRSQTSDLRLLMVGYNRRFSPLSEVLKDRAREGPLALTYRINAGAIPADSWIQDKEIGGGRILGEVCHFVDYLSFLCGSSPSWVHAYTMDDPHGNQDTTTITIRFQNGSIGSINYFSNGSKGLPKEYVEVHGHGLSAVMHDFRELTIYGGGRPFRKKLLVQDKGQKQEVRLFLEAIRNNTPPPIPVEDLFCTSRACFAVLESLRTGSPVRLY